MHFFFPQMCNKQFMIFIVQLFFIQKIYLGHLWNLISNGNKLWRLRQGFSLLAVSLICTGCLVKYIIWFYNHQFYILQWYWRAQWYFDIIQGNGELPKRIEICPMDLDFHFDEPCSIKLLLKKINVEHPSDKWGYSNAQNCNSYFKFPSCC